MKLDSARNHMMLLNLWLSMIGISLMLTTVLPSAFGMNIVHGMEEARWYFYAVLGASLSGGGAAECMQRVRHCRGGR
jgi:Mg2+ and Co2+ transporter CorA